MTPNTNGGITLVNTVKAISKMKESEGSSVKNIVRYMAQNMSKYRTYPLNSQTLKNGVCRALKTGIKKGFIIHVGKKFKINRACAFHQRKMKKGRTGRRKSPRKSRPRRGRKSRGAKRHTLHSTDEDDDFEPTNVDMANVNNQMDVGKATEPMDKGRRRPKRRRQSRRRSRSRSRSRRSGSVKRHTDNENMNPNNNSTNDDDLIKPNQNASSTEEISNKDIQIIKKIASRQNLYE